MIALCDIVVVVGPGGQLDVVAVPKRDFLDFETLPSIWRRDVQGIVVVRTVWSDDADRIVQKFQQIVQKFQDRSLALDDLVNQVLDDLVDQICSFGVRGLTGSSDIQAIQDVPQGIPVPCPTSGLEER